MAELAVKRLIIKVGTSALTGGTPHLVPRRMLELVRQIALACEQGYEVVFVTSGAIAAGRDVLEQPALGRDIPAKQMLSAIGQPHLMHLYADLFAIFDRHVAQLLLTRADFTQRQSYLNARDTIEALLACGVVPIINENDTLATEEIRVGDNDNLSALVANLVDADLLIMLTDQPGLFTSDPRSNPDAELINTVAAIDDALWHTAGGSGSAQGTGGMITKIQAAQLATRSGTAVVIAAAAQPGIVQQVLAPGGRAIGTWFEPQTPHLESRKRWILSEKPPGVVIVDSGAARILRGGGASLLPVGIVRVTGEFQRGMAVAVKEESGGEIARGLVNYSSEDLAKIRGARSDAIAGLLGYTAGDEVIHRDHLVLV